MIFWGVHAAVEVPGYIVFWIPRAVFRNCRILHNRCGSFHNAIYGAPAPRVMPWAGPVEFPRNCTMAGMSVLASFALSSSVTAPSIQAKA
jgi:hypothetical protein